MRLLGGCQGAASLLLFFPSSALLTLCGVVQTQQPTLVVFSAAPHSSLSWGLIMSDTYVFGEPVVNSDRSFDLGMVVFEACRVRDRRPTGFLAYTPTAMLCRGLSVYRVDDRFLASKYLPVRGDAA